jgi:hypothetical protein
MKLARTYAGMTSLHFRQQKKDIQSWRVLFYSWIEQKIETWSGIDFFFRPTNPNATTEQ